MKGGLSALALAGAGALILVLNRPSQYKPKWEAGDILAMKGDYDVVEQYTVRGVDGGAYIMAKGAYPDDTGGISRYSASYIDRIASFVRHVEIVYGE
jgi:hypothetical protein